MPQDQSKIKVGAAVAALRAAGYAVCKPDAKEKKPTYRGWAAKSLEAKDFKDGDQLGVMAGALSDGNKPGHALVILDLDTPEAVASADAHLPPTAMSEGRAGKPQSHRYFLVPLDSIPDWARSPSDQGGKACVAKCGHPGPFTKSFKHRETCEEVIRFLGTGGQSVCPPSLWTSKDGTKTERREWTGSKPDIPAVVQFLDLWQAACELASACGAEIPNVIPRPTPRPSAPSTDSEAKIVERAKKYLAKMEPSVAGQAGHNKLMAAARAVAYGFDLPPELSLSILEADFNPRCAPCWSQHELEHKVQDADRCPFGKPRGYLRDALPPNAKESPNVKFGNTGEQKTGVNAGHSAQSADSAREWPQPVPFGLAPDVPTLPVDVLSPWLAEFVRAQSVELQVPFDLPALLALGAAAAGIARNVTASPRPGWENEPTNLFVMPCLPPGERKSQSFSKVFAPVAELERELREQAEPLVKDAESELRILAKRVEHLEAKISKID